MNIRRIFVIIGIVFGLLCGANAQTSLKSLSLAAGNGDLEAVKMLLKGNANPDDGMVAACENGHADVVAILIGAGAFYSKSDIGAYTKKISEDRYLVEADVLMEKAIEKNNPEIVKQLLLLKIYESNDGEYVQRSGFRKAIANGSIDIVKAFVAAHEDVSDTRTDYTGKTLVQIATAKNHPEVVAYLKEAEKDQAAAVVEKETEKAKMKSDRLAAKEKEKATENETIQKKLLSYLDHPIDLFGMANTRYRKFNGTVYDCAEPIDFLNRLSAFMFVLGQYNNRAESLIAIKERIESESRWLNNSPWYKIRQDCSILPVQVRQVTPDGLVVRLNSEQDVTILVLLKNHPKQKTAVDGDALVKTAVDGSVSGEYQFVIKTNPYRYAGAFGEIRTIPSYDLGIVIPAPSGSVVKLPIPDASQ